MCVLCVCTCGQQIVPRWLLYNRIIVWWRVVWWPMFIITLLKYWNSLVFQWLRHSALLPWAQVQSLVSEVISQKPSGKPPPPKKFPEVLLTQLLFFNLYSFGALSFNQIWSDQSWKSHWKIFNWIMLISISFISQWPWRLEICMITSILLLFLECVSTCMDGWIKIYLSRL